MLTSQRIFILDNHTVEQSFDLPDLLALTKNTKPKSHSFLLHFDRQLAIRINTSKRHEFVEILKSYYFQCTVSNLKIFGLYNNLDDYLTQINDRNGDGMPPDSNLLFEENHQAIARSLISVELDASVLERKTVQIQWKNTEVKLEHFEIKEMIGKGAFGRVYLVQNCYTGEVFAMK